MHAFQAVGKLRDGAASLAAAGMGVAFKKMGESLARTAAGVALFTRMAVKGGTAVIRLGPINANVSSVGYAVIGTVLHRATADR